MLFAARRPPLLDKPILLGVVYGLITYVGDEPRRRSAALRRPAAAKPLSIATQLFAHIVLVGIPMSPVAARYFLRPRTA